MRLLSAACALCVLLVLIPLSESASLENYVFDTDPLAGINIHYASTADGGPPAKTPQEALADKIQVLKVLDGTVPEEILNIAMRQGIPIDSEMFKVQAVSRQLEIANVVGSKSSYQITYDAEDPVNAPVPPAAKASFEAAFALWAEAFPSNGVTIRVYTKWATLAKNVLGSAGAGFIRIGELCNNPPGKRIPDGSWYTPALIAALTGVDATSSTTYHIRMTFNRDVSLFPLPPLRHSLHSLC
jgi:hypothetical protein